MINVGDTVTWESQAQGSWVRKTGKVIAVMMGCLLTMTICARRMSLETININERR